MTPPLVWSSVTRILRHSGRNVSWRPRPRTAWSDGDYVVAEVQGRRGGVIEAPDGHHMHVVRGDRVVGALGVRRATLEVVGDWRVVDPWGNMQSLTRGGVLGSVTSAASAVQPLVVDLRYLGHLELNGAPAHMADWSLPAPGGPVRSPTPTVVLIGTSMSSGKTTTARILIRRLVRMGLTVAGAKLTGVARLGDILAMRDSGASAVFDFVDAGLPSTVAPRSAVIDSTRRVLGALDATRADVLVVEAGASPLEPYRGDVVLEDLRSRARLAVLCASDPYAVVGALEAFGSRPDLVAGRAASTSAAVALVSQLSGLEALDVMDPDVWPRLDGILSRSFGIGAGAGAPPTSSPRVPRR